MKASHKKRAIDDGAVLQAVRTAPTLAAAAAQLGIDYSTLYRWARADPQIGEAVKARMRPARARVRRPVQSAGRFTTPEKWATYVRRRWTLGASDHVLLDMAVRAWAISQNDKATHAAQLSAMGRYQQLLKQLELEEDTDDDGEIEETPTNVRAFPRPVAR